LRQGAAITSLVFLLGSVLCAQGPSQEARLSLMLFGDVNLGRTVGQELLRGNTEFPFRYVRDTLSRGDVVFVNLESQLSDQDGETQHPKYNLIFTGPPPGATVLKQANVSVVSTANNHAFDYGMKALRETIVRLQAGEVQFVGTSFDSVPGATPAIVERQGIRVGFLAYTGFVNLKGAWIGRIALFDSLRACRDIQDLRPKVDFIVVSYHGGVEYTDIPSAALRRDFRSLVDAGADLVVGHHPHYVQGIESYRNKLIFYSLGNFVFYQPQRELARLGLGVDVTLVRRGGSVTAEGARLLPLRAGLQPIFDLTGEEGDAFLKRLRKLSPVQITESERTWNITLHHDHE
jgi:poly-gamma-glutamate capsule biosynthesis protein CapA/YwtB (metallophosphatase superfamily)